MVGESNINKENLLGNEMNQVGQFFGGRGIFGLRMNYQRIIIWVLAILFLIYSIIQGQILAGLLGLVVAYVINR